MSATFRLSPSEWLCVCVCLGVGISVFQVLNTVFINEVYISTSSFVVDKMSAKFLMFPIVGGSARRVTPRPQTSTMPAAPARGRVG